LQYFLQSQLYLLLGLQLFPSTIRRAMNTAIGLVNVDAR
jgi:hypothetical protein